MYISRVQAKPVDKPIRFMKKVLLDLKELLKKNKR
jgi:hypothetical protein